MCDFIYYFKNKNNCDYRLIDVLDLIFALKWEKQKKLKGK